MLTQFVAAFDDIVIGRFNKSRVEQDKINVRYVYAPKQRVFLDLVNENKTLTLPVVSVNVNNVSRDPNRVFNKLDGFTYQGTVTQETVSRKVKSPIPININISCSIMTRYQTDMDQIISNFVPFCNPYVIISWKVPSGFSLSKDQEIRSEVLWSGDINLDYPVETTGAQKARVVADTSFTIKGWLFKDVNDPVGNIFTIDTDFHNENLLTTYDNYPTLSGNTYTFPTSTNLINEIENITLSGAPDITNVYYNNVQLFDSLTISKDALDINGSSNYILLNGLNFENINGLLLSGNSGPYYNTALTTISDFQSGSHDIGKSITGHSINYEVINDNTLSLNLSSPGVAFGSNTIMDLRFVPYTLSAGYAVSNKSLISQTYSGNDTFIIVKF